MIFYNTYFILMRWTFSLDLIYAIYLMYIFNFKFLKHRKKMASYILSVLHLYKSEMNVNKKNPAYLKSFIAFPCIWLSSTRYTNAWWLEIVIVVVNFVRWHQWMSQWTGLQIHLLSHSHSISFPTNERTNASFAWHAKFDCMEMLGKIILT